MKTLFFGHYAFLTTAFVCMILGKPAIYSMTALVISQVYNAGYMLSNIILEKENA